MGIARSVFVVLITILIFAGGNAAMGKTVAELSPYLCSGALRDAILSDLGKDVIISCETLILTAKDLDAEVARSPRSIIDQVKKYPVFALNRMVTERLIAMEAQNWAKENGKYSGASEQRMVQAYLASRLPKITATDEEVEQFYKEHMSMFGGAEYEKIKGLVRTVVEDDRRSEAEQKFLDAVGKRHTIKISSSWVKARIPEWSKNPVESARLSGKPTLVNFSVVGCCDKTFPIIEAVRGKIADKANVVFIHVGEQEVLSSLYGIMAIPVQIFFDRNGKEVFRHQGVMSEDEIMARFREIGVG